MFLKEWCNTPLHLPSILHLYDSITCFVKSFCFMHIFLFPFPFFSISTSFLLPSLLHSLPSLILLKFFLLFLSFLVSLPTFSFYYRFTRIFDTSIHGMHLSLSCECLSLFFVEMFILIGNKSLHPL